MAMVSSVPSPRPVPRSHSGSKQPDRYSIEHQKEADFHPDSAREARNEREGERERERERGEGNEIHNQIERERI